MNSKFSPNRLNLQTGNLSEIETQLLIDAVYLKYGYDFRDYACPSLTRRIHNFMIKSRYKQISRIIPDILRDEALFDHFINQICVSVTEMFRDPAVYREARKRIIPFLSSFPRINVWHAGCATGEEVYSFAILLAEEGLYERANIYATDMDPKSIEIARNGIYPIEAIQQGTDNYRQSGGKASFSDYYHARYGKAILPAWLKQNITFSTHNLATDTVFNCMHLIVCRNVLIYFNKHLQDRVLELLSRSLAHNGLLVLGTKERLDFSSVSGEFEPIDRKLRIYRKTGLNGECI